MGWKRLSVVPVRERRESILQQVFNSWANRVAAIAGAPNWLADLRLTNTQRAFPCHGYSFVPDVLWEAEDKTYVIELKHYWKTEPLGLAEVLHHAAMLEARAGGSPVTPVLVTSYSPWIRGAMSWLRTHSLPDMGLLTLEVDVLEDGRIIWFDDPHASWVAGSAPKCLPETYSVGWQWHWIAATSTWCGTRSAHAERPIFFDEPYVMVSALDSSRHGSVGDHVLWQGTPPAAQTGSSRQSWADSAFYLSCADGADAAPIPPGTI